MVSRLILSLLACSLYFASPGANVVVTGMFPGAEGEEVRLMEYLDLVSHRPGEMDARIIDHDGAFRFEFHLDEPRLLFLRFMHGRHEFYAAPGNQIHLAFDTLHIDRPGLQRSFPVEVSHPGDAGGSLNGHIRYLNNMVVNYLETHVAGTVRLDHRHSLQAFALRLKEAARQTGNPFAMTHARYYLAYLERTLNTKGFDTLVNTYLVDDPVYDHHPMYMDFLQTMFDTYLFAGSPSFGFRDLQEAVNRQQGYRALMNTLGKDPVFADEVFRELVMLTGLQKMMGMEGFDADAVLDILRQVHEQGQHRRHRQMAANILAQQTDLRPGFPAPDLSLPGEEKHGLSLHEYRGQYLYLFFWAGWCPVSMAEAGPMTTLAKSLPDDVALLGILVDRDGRHMPEWYDRDEPPFPLVHFGGDYRLLDRYRVRTIPQYFLVDPQGRIAANPFSSPTGGAADALDEFTGR